MQVSRAGEYYAIRICPRCVRTLMDSVGCNADTLRTAAQSHFNANTTWSLVEITMLLDTFVG